MRRTHLAILIVGVSVMLAAEPVCTRLIWHVPVRHNATKKLDHKPTAKTIARWRAWDLAKSLREYEVACAEVETKDAVLDAYVLPTEPPVWVDQEVIPDSVVAAALQPQLALVESDYTLPVPPLPIVIDAPATTPTPEPASAWMVLVGLCGLGWIKWRAA